MRHNMKYDNRETQVIHAGDRERARKEDRQDEVSNQILQPERQAVRSRLEQVRQGQEVDDSAEILESEKLMHVLQEKGRQRAK